MANFVPQGIAAAEVQEAENALPFTQRTGTRTVSSGYLRAVGATLESAARTATIVGVVDDVDESDRGAVFLYDRAARRCSAARGPVRA